MGAYGEWPPAEGVKETPRTLPSEGAKQSKKKVLPFVLPASAATAEVVRYLPPGRTSLDSAGLLLGVHACLAGLP
jgi:hypothetical protein